MIETIQNKLWPILQKIYYKLDSARINLNGDRDVEWSWIASNIPSGSGKALDFGCGPSNLALIAARKGFDATAIDLQPIVIPYKHPRYRFLQGGILTCLPNGIFDLVINCSTIEHVGVAGRFGVAKSEPNGDIETMRRLFELMKSQGIMLLTIPIGQDEVFYPYHRVYGKNRLPVLLENYIVKKEEFWIKDTSNRWILCDKETALNSKAGFDRNRKVYALGLFVLKKP